MQPCGGALADLFQSRAHRYDEELEGSQALKHPELCFGSVQHNVLRMRLAPRKITVVNPLAIGSESFSVDSTEALHAVWVAFESVKPSILLHVVLASPPLSHDQDGGISGLRGCYTN